MFSRHRAELRILLLVKDSSLPAAVACRVQRGQMPHPSMLGLAGEILALAHCICGTYSRLQQRRVPVEFLQWTEMYGLILTSCCSRWPKPL